jgi:hypothetical protein
MTTTRPVLCRHCHREHSLEYVDAKGRVVMVGQSFECRCDWTWRWLRELILAVAECAQAQAAADRERRDVVAWLKGAADEWKPYSKSEAKMLIAHAELIELAQHEGAAER